MLASARIGAIHSVVFGGFSAQALATRIDDAGSRYVVTCDGYYRRGEFLAHKQKADEALELADDIVVLPMVGMVRSLNVSVATALLLYEAYRQRDDQGFYDHCRLPDETYRRLLFEWSYPRVAQALEAEGRPYPELGEDGEILEG